MGYIEISGSEAAWIREKLTESFGPFEVQPLVQRAVAAIKNDIQWLHPGGLNAIAFDIVEGANRHGQLDRLLVEVAKQRPHRPDLRALAVYFSVREGWKAALDDHGMKLTNRGLEKLTTHGDPFVDSTRLAQWIVHAERQVCQVRCGSECGSGFLVGPNLVLTCFHVVQGYLSKVVPAADVQVRFDYHNDLAGKAPPYDALPWIGIDEAWEIPHAPYSQADITLQGEPTEQELDFALLKLAGSPGQESPPGEDAPRGWFDMSVDMTLPPAEAPILIAQHPGNEQFPPPQLPLKITFATPGFEGLNANGTRVSYKPSTKPGSSGSPVFGPDLRAVALHHNRGQIDPRAVDLVLNNRGIPLSKIRAALADDVRALLIAPLP